MASKLGMRILRTITITLGVLVLAIVVLTAGTAFMPGTKIGRTFGASAEALAGDTSAEPERGPRKPRKMSDFLAGEPDAGTSADAGSEQQGP